MRTTNKKSFVIPNSIWNPVIILLLSFVMVLGLSGCDKKIDGDIGNQSKNEDVYNKSNLSIKQGINKKLPENLTVDTSEWVECKDYDNGTITYVPKRWGCDIKENQYKFLAEQFLNTIFLYGDLKIDEKNEFDIKNCKQENYENSVLFYNCKNEADYEVIIGKRLNDVNYIFTWTIDSSQKAVETDLEVWYPEIKFSVLDLREIVKSFSMLKMERDNRFSEESYLLAEELLKSINDKIDLSMFKINDEIKSPFSNKKAVLLSQTDDSDVTKIFINNDGNLEEDYAITKALNISNGFSNVKWLDDFTVEYELIQGSPVGDAIVQKKVIKIKK